MRSLEVDSILSYTVQGQEWLPETISSAYAEILTPVEFDAYAESLGQLLTFSQLPASEEITDAQLEELATFKDPFTAYQTARSYPVMELQEGLNILVALHYTPESNEMEEAAPCLQTLDPLLLTAFDQVVETSTALAAEIEMEETVNLVGLARQVRLAYHSSQPFVEQYNTALTMLHESNAATTSKELIFKSLTYTHRSPVAVTKAGQIIEDATELFAKLAPASYHKFFQTLLPTCHDPEAVARRCVNVFQALKENNVDFALLDEFDFSLAAGGIIELGDITPGNPRFERLPQKLKTSLEVASQKALEELYAARQSGDEAALPTLHLKNFEEIAKELDALGLTETEAQTMFASWVSYDGGYDATADRGTERFINHAAIKHAAHILEEVEAVSQYIKTYGLSEFREIVQTFEVHHFLRDPSGKFFHNQLGAWKEGTEAVHKVMVAAHDDWGRQLDSCLVQYRELHPNHSGFFYFEASNGRSIDTFLREISVREHNNQRQPAVEDVIIVAHANPKVLVMGPNGGRIKVSDYEKLAKTNARPKQYDLGPIVRYILDGCSAAGSNPDGENIAQSVSEWHRVRTEALAQNIGGVCRIDPEGKVMFKLPGVKNGPRIEMAGLAYADGKLVTTSV